MRMSFRRFDLKLANTWAIATDVRDGNVVGKDICPVVHVELSDPQGRHGIGEGSPSTQYDQSWETVFRFLGQVDAARLSFDDIPGSLAYLRSLPQRSLPAICALDIALVDGAARAAGQPLCRHLGLDFPDAPRVTSFTIGLASPEEIARKVREAGRYPVLKMKLGASTDRDNLAALRLAAPGKILRVDANAAWSTRERALDEIRWLAEDGHVEFVEQPMPPDAPEPDLIWLRERSPLPLVADESYQDADDADHCARCFHGVNVKLVKTGGVIAAKSALEAARSRGLRTMLGCMIESGVLITAAAHLASLADWLDLDGNMLVTNDPYPGVVNRDGRLDFAGLAQQPGLGVKAGR